MKQVCWDFAKGGVPDIWVDPKLAERKLELQQGAMYNLLHLALMGGYQGEAAVENFWDWAHPAEQGGEGNFETLLLSLVVEANYPSGECGMISPDTLDGKLTPEQAQAIFEQDEPEIVLLAGGTDAGGDSETQLDNAQVLAD
ncbi:MAG: hypothetical protein U9R25_10395 [Chloroflexota bacterium]|nr:hypothetical protein [Chloroflexota bacterium]